MGLPKLSSQTTWAKARSSRPAAQVIMSLTICICCLRWAELTDVSYRTKERTQWTFHDYPQAELLAHPLQLLKLSYRLLYSSIVTPMAELMGGAPMAELLGGAFKTCGSPHDGACQRAPSPWHLPEGPGPSLCSPASPCRCK